MHLNLLLLCATIHLILSTEDNLQRKVEKNVINVTCSNASYELVHITSTSSSNKDNVIHYLISTINIPTIIIKQVFNSTSLTINEANICNKTGEAFTFSDGNKDYSGIVINRIIPYNDTSDNVSLPEKADGIGADVMPDFKWNLISGDNKSVFFNGEIFNKTSLLYFNTKICNSAGRAKDLPHNKFHANVSEFTLILKDFFAGNFLRYAIEVAFFSSHQSESAGKYFTTSSIDDEYTPGIFKLWQVNFPMTELQTFASWKPVVYMKKDYSRQTQSLLYQFGTDSKSLGTQGKLSTYSFTKWSIATGIKGVTFYALNITFGMPKDGWYKETNFSSWTGMIGYGDTPIDSISQVVFIIIGICFGAPVVLILVGIFTLLIRRVKFSNNHYSAIN